MSRVEFQSIIRTGFLLEFFSVIIIKLVQILQILQCKFAKKTGNVRIKIKIYQNFAKTPVNLHDIFILLANILMKIIAKFFCIW